jgi:hypothetical protein
VAVATSGSAPLSASPAAPLVWDVAWADLPAPPPYDPNPLPTTPPPVGAPACTARQLVGRSLGYPGISQDDGDVVSLRNISGRTCLLTGAVHAVLYGHGAPDLTVSSHGSQHMPETASFDMPPGQSTEVWFFATGDCGSGPPTGIKAIPITSARIRIPGDGDVLVSSLRMPRECGTPTVEAFQQALPLKTYPPSPLQGAKAFIEAPATVRAGEAINYVVTLANLTRQPITMTPCPGFEQWLNVGTPGKDVYGLNCAGHRLLAAGQRLRFQMRLAIPADAPSGPAQLRWSPAGAYPFAHAAVTVVGLDNPCAAGNLVAEAEPAQAFDGTGYYDVKDRGTALAVTVTNTADTTCTLQGAPTVQLSGPGGRSLDLPMAKGSPLRRPAYVSPPQVRLPPGGSARTTLAWHTRWCAADPNPVTIAVALPSGGGTLSVHADQGWTPPPCSGFNWADLTADDFGPA